MRTNLVKVRPAGQRAVLVALLLAVAGAVVAPSPASASARTPAQANFSANVYFPLVQGAVWKYNVVGGPEGGTNQTSTVVGGTKTAAGEQVQMKFKSSAKFQGKPLPAYIADYLIEPDGVIKVASGSSGGLSTTISGDVGSYMIPPASQITHCGCSYSGKFTASAEGMSFQGTLKETATSKGTVQVTVPASSSPYTALQLDAVVNIKLSAASMKVSATASYDFFLVKNVGLVKTSNASMKLTLFGSSTTSAVGNEILASYTP
ncbi:MAG TPA: hypothetical protein VME46_20275 [Acidimicrobiales bacterium]|nr:hypothetical protein [Acidimicrobiales bacterium]